MKRIICVLAVLIGLILPAAASPDLNGGLGYFPYIYNSEGEPVATPAAYTSVKTITGETLGLGQLKDLSCIIYDNAGTVYIADSGNNRIDVYKRQNPTGKNYSDMMTIMSNSWVPFLRYLFNTVFITVAGTFGHVILASMCAFPLAKKKFPGRDVIFNIIVLALMFNATVTAIPNYIIMANLKWINTYLALIVPSFATPLGLYLMKQFMEQIPDSLLEAARIDGAGQWRIFWRIAMPNVKAAWLTLTLLQVQNLWNMGASNFIFNEELKTLSYALGQILAGGIARAGVGAAVTVIMMLVPITIFITTQSSIIETMSTSGMKE